MCNLKYDVNQHISQTKADSLLWLPRGGGREGKNWELGIRRCKLIYRMDKQEVPTVLHMELYSISCDKP